MNELHISSKIIKSVSFRQDNGQLYIRFQNGEERRFVGVPTDVVADFVQAPSPGTHYLKHIRHQYRRIAA
jgi:hypothetical protein